MAFTTEPDWEVVYPPGYAAHMAALARWRRFFMPLLVPASWAYQVVSNAVRGSRTAATPPAPDGTIAVSVGNLVVGGGGKTPLAMALVEAIAAAGGTPVYISRGFGSDAERLDAVTVVLPASGARFSAVAERGVRYLRRDDRRLAALVGDEGAMAAVRLPTIPLIFCRNKLAALEAAAIQFRPSHAVLDDAFQSWGLPRDVDIVVLDGARPFGNGWLLPAGQLREPPEALDRAHVIAIDVADPQQLPLARETIAGRAGVERPTFGIRRRVHIDIPDGSPVAVVTAIGRPAVFERQISEAGADVKVSFRFADHHRYSSRDLAWIVEQAHARGVGAIVTTEKDWAKISGLSLPPARFCVARLSLEFIDGNPLECIRKAAE